VSDVRSAFAEVELCVFSSYVKKAMISGALGLYKVYFRETSVRIQIATFVLYFT
jgi:hypothetical protein